jgi:hypothetical protein
MSRYYSNYNQYLGSQRCCEIKSQGPKGPEGPTGPPAIGQRGHTGATGIGYTGVTGSTGPTGSIPSLELTASPGPVVIYDIASKTISYNNAKSFIIDHPINPDKYLVHTCLEGPEVGVYYRGNGKISNNKFIEIELPYYVSTIASEFTVNLTPIYDGKIHILNSSIVKDNKFKVYGDNCDFYWTVFGKRYNINVEPLKNNVKVKGDGPYLYI